MLDDGLAVTERFVLEPLGARDVAVEKSWPKQVKATWDRADVFARSFGVRV